MLHSGHKPITNVAIYLRKSRADETEKDLAQHRVILTDICAKNRWKYKTYEEIFCSASINTRPEMINLLRDVEDGLYDAVLVVDQDRLSRGDGRDATRVKEAFERSNTIIIIRDRELDLSADQDRILYDINAMFAHWEYETIVKRFRRGKQQWARLGRVPMARHLFLMFTLQKSVN